MTNQEISQVVNMLAKFQGDKAKLKKFREWCIKVETNHVLLRRCLTGGAEPVDFEKGNPKFQIKQKGE